MPSATKRFRQAFALPLVIVLSQGLLPGSAVIGAPLRPPENIEQYYQLFVTVQALTSFPFTLFSSGADKSQFIADELINRDELMHTTAFLKSQLVIRLIFSPDTVKELQATINVCEFLLQRFNRIATQRDAQGNLALGEGDIEQLFAPPSNRAKERLNS